jgi:hypothetical protein
MTECKRRFEEIDDPNAVMKTGFREQKVALFEPGTWNDLRVLEPELKRRGLQVAMITHPTEADIANLRVEDGYFYGPSWITWHKDAETYAQSIDCRGSSVAKAIKKKKYKDKVKAVLSRYRVNIAPLTPGAYEEWRQVYAKAIARKRLGVQVFGPNLCTSSGQTQGDLSNWRLLTVNSKETGGLGGGVLLVADENARVLKIKGAAFDRSNQHGGYSLSLAAFDRVVSCAMEDSYEKVSYGSDPNFYGELIGPGVLKHKASLGFKPIHYDGADEEVFGHTRIIKLLDVADRLTSYMLFTFKNGLGSELVLHYFGKFEQRHISFPWGVQIVRHAGKEATVE